MAVSSLCFGGLPVLPSLIMEARISAKSQILELGNFSANFKLGEIWGWQTYFGYRSYPFSKVEKK